MPSTVTVQQKKTEKSKKRSSHFLYGRLHIESNIFKRLDAHNGNERDRIFWSVDRMYIGMMLLKCNSKKNNYEMKKKTHTQTNDNIV